MSAECRKCGRDLDGDFNCGACDCKTKLEAAQRELAELKSKNAYLQQNYHEAKDNEKIAMERLTEAKAQLQMTNSNWPHEVKLHEELDKANAENLGLLQLIDGQRDEIERLIKAHDENVNLMKDLQSLLKQCEPEIQSRDQEIERLNKRVVEVNGFLFDANAHIEMLVGALKFYEDQAWKDDGIHGNGYQHWMSDVGTKARKALFEHEKWKTENSSEPIRMRESDMSAMIEDHYQSAIAAIGHLRSVLKNYNKQDADHALSVTSGYETK